LALQTVGSLISKPAIKHEQLITDGIALLVCAGVVTGTVTMKSVPRSVGGVLLTRSCLGSLGRHPCQQPLQRMVLMAAATAAAAAGTKTGTRRSGTGGYIICNGRQTECM
jgi:hypothetical protein